MRINFEMDEEETEEPEEEYYEGYVIREFEDEGMELD